MRRHVTPLPYEPHRWVDEVPDVALANMRVWSTAAAVHREPAAVALATDLLVRIDQPDRGPLPPAVRPAENLLFEDLAYAIADLDHLRRTSAATAAITAIFGSATRKEVRNICQGCSDTVIGQPPNRAALRARIISRLQRQSANATDQAWGMLHGHDDPDLAAALRVSGEDVAA